MHAECLGSVCEQSSALILVMPTGYSVHAAFATRVMLVVTVLSIIAADGTAFGGADVHGSGDDRDAPRVDPGSGDGGGVLALSWFGQVAE